MKENEIALELIGRIGINNFKDKDFVESIKKCVLHSEIGSSNTINVSNDSNSDRELDDHDNSEKKSSLKKESLRNKTYNLKEEVPIQVQLLEHLVYLRNESGFSKHDFLIKEDLKCRSLLIFAKNLLVELKRNSSWQSVLDDKSENVLEYPFEGMEKLFALILMMTRLEKYLRSESTAAPILANNVLLSFRYIFQSESSNLAVIQHPEWAIEYLRECVKKYMAVFKKAKSDMKLDCTNYFKALMPEPYCDDYGLLEEFVLIGAECSVDDVASSWCLLIAKEARLFVYSRLPFLVYDYFMENEDDRVGLRELTRMIASPKKSTVLEVSRSSFSDDKVTSVIYSLVGSMVEFASYLRGFDPASSYELFSDFDNNTIVPFIMIQFYRYSNAGGSEGYTDGGASNSTPNTAINTDINNANNSAINTGNNSDINNANNSTDSHSNNDIVKNYGNNNLSGGNAARYADGDYGADYEASDSNTGNEGSDNMPSRDGDEATLESKILLCFESNVLYGCLDALLEMENKHCMSISKKLLTLESFSDSIGVRTGLNTTLYLQDDQFLSQVSNVLIAVLNLVDRRCQCLKFVESKKQYAAKVVVPLIEYFIDSVKHIWNSLENVLESCTISCMLLESATVLHEFLLKFTLSEFMPDTLASLESITQKMVGIINQYFVELYYEPFKNVHRQPLEVMAHITHKLLQMCALSSCKNYNKILRTTLSDMEKVLISTLIPSKSLDFILMDEEDVETSLNNCEYILESVKKLVEPRECEETMQQVQDVKVILSMETVELKTSAEYLNLLGTGKISSKNNMEENNQESQGNTTNQINKGDSFVSSIIFDDFEGDCTDDIHDSLIVSKIKQKLKIKKLTLSQTYTLIKHILYGTASDDYPLDEGEHSFYRFSYMFNIQQNTRNVPHVDGNYHTICYLKVEVTEEIASVAKRAYNTLSKLEKVNNVLFCEQPTQADSDYTYSDTEMDTDSQTDRKKVNPSHLHVSLCKPLYLRRQFIDSFLENLRGSLQHLKPFYLMLENKVSICASENQNRYFAVSLVDKACRDNTILPIIDLVDKVVSSFGFEKYYSQRKPHVSLASTRDISLVLNELYKAVQPSEEVYSSNYWTNLDQYLSRYENLVPDSSNYYNATSVNYTFDFAAAQGPQETKSEQDKICVYVDEIHVLVGSRDHTIKLN